MTTLDQRQKAINEKIKEMNDNMALFKDAFYTNHLKVLSELPEKTKDADANKLFAQLIDKLRSIKSEFVPLIPYESGAIQPANSKDSRIAIRAVGVENTDPHTSKRVFKEHERFIFIFETIEVPLPFAYMIWAYNIATKQKDVLYVGNSQTARVSLPAIKVRNATDLPVGEYNIVVAVVELKSGPNARMEGVPLKDSHGKDIIDKVDVQIIPSDGESRKGKHEYYVRFINPKPGAEFVNDPDTIIPYEIETNYPEPYHFMITLPPNVANIQGEAKGSHYKGSFKLGKKIAGGEKTMAIVISPYGPEEKYRYEVLGKSLMHPIAENKELKVILR